MYLKLLLQMLIFFITMQISKESMFFFTKEEYTYILYSEIVHARL